MRLCSARRRHHRHDYWCRPRRPSPRCTSCSTSRTITPFVKGVVGWIDFEATDAPRSCSKNSRLDPLLVGLRPMVQDIADDDWLLRPTLKPALDEVVAHDARVRCTGAAASSAAAQQGIHRTLAEALSRGGSLAPKPLIRDLRDGAVGHRYRAPIAAFPHVMYKQSGLVTEAAPEVGRLPTSRHSRRISLKSSGHSAYCSAPTGP